MPYKRKFPRHKRPHQPFAPEEPKIVWGQFVGRKLSELSDAELNRFMRSDARFQSHEPIKSVWGLPPTCSDFSQYWFARYELERRKPEIQRTVSFKISSNDTSESIALKLFEHGFRAACRQYHPDTGGEKILMQQLNAARELAKDRLKR
jgi:hypothetical protein